jgi:hypothetical protein
MLQVTDAHRHARMGRRHGLHADHRYGDVVSATTAMTALHATEPATPHLALHTRIGTLTVEDVEAALYDARSLVKPLVMRRTLFVVTRDLLPSVVGSAGRRVAEAGRKRLIKDAGDLTKELGPHWIETVSREIVDTLTGVELSARQLRDALPHVGGTFTAAPGSKWSAEVPMMSRFLTILGATGDVVRAHNAGHWRISRPLWTTMATWLGEEMTPTDARDGYAEVVRRWLWTFGPGTEADLVWWLGATKAAVRTALADADAVPVTLEHGSAAWVLPDDTADLEAPAATEPWVALLPTLDPTTMGWRDRAFYLDPVHTPYLFDRAGNGGTTAWVDGRIVGCWVQDEHERVRLVLLESVSRRAQRALEAEAARLDEFLRGEHITNVFASPQMKHERLS